MISDIRHYRFLLFASAAGVFSTAGSLHVQSGHFLHAAAFFVMTMGLVMIWASERMAQKTVVDLGLNNRSSKAIVDNIDEHLMSGQPMSEEAEAACLKICQSFGIDRSAMLNHKAMFRFVICAVKRQP